MHIIAVNLLKSKCNAARSPADPTRNIHKKRVFVINGDSDFLKLRADSESGNRITKEKVNRTFVINEVACRVICRFPASLCNRCLIIVRIFDDGNAFGAEKVFLPLSRVGGHVNCNLEAELGTDNAD